jgi:ketosteroid isomerase-like protein
MTLAALALAFPALAQQPKAADADQKALAQIEDELAVAVVKKDAAVFERYLAPGFVFVSPDGAVQDRTTFIADIKNDALKMESTKNDEMKIRTFGTTAIAVYRSTDKGTFKGKDISGQYRWTDVFVQQGGKWQIVSTQGTPMPPPQPAKPGAAPQPPKK